MTMAPELRARIAGRRVIASISGGKDSAAMSLWLTEMGIEHDRVFCDTGWEADVTYDYLRGELTRVVGPITEIRGEQLMEDLILSKGMFPSRMRRFCTQELKVFPLAKFVKHYGSNGRECDSCRRVMRTSDEMIDHRWNCLGDYLPIDVINAVGIRAEESADRALLQEWEFQETFDCDVWRPLLDWKVDDVIAIHRRHGLRPNPLYLQGASRVGCWPCINARKDEIALIDRVDPARITRLRVLESRVAEAAESRHARDVAKWHESPTPYPVMRSGKDDIWLAGAQKRWRQLKKRMESPFSPPAWFQARIEDREAGGFPRWPIDKVVGWSKTSHGGKQVELFAAPASDAGCMRWGLCETAPEVAP